ncbi:hypothetical protein J6590_053343 [Homalodisca vitripennis]|nr:hypothetical protein J6590_053343 [Homalodisca vitripennis]
MGCLPMTIIDLRSDANVGVFLPDILAEGDGRIMSRRRVLEAAVKEGGGVSELSQFSDRDGTRLTVRITAYRLCSRTDYYLSSPPAQL